MYKEKHGDCNVPKGCAANTQLANWVDKQRQNYQLRNKSKKSWMTEERIAKLNNIGFEWVCNEDAWETRFTQLVAYKEAHGHCNVPKNYGPNKQLGTWVNKQRQNYQLRNKGKKSSMTEERIAKLNEVGFKWKLR